MKKLSNKQKLHQTRVARKRLRRLRKERRRERSLKRMIAGFIRLRAPTVFDIGNSMRRAKVITFLTKLRRICVTEKNPVYIDFYETRQMYADATLLFQAELFRVRRIMQRKAKIRCREPDNRKIRQVLKQTGIHRLIGSYSGLKATHDDVVHWRYATGSDVNGQKYDEVLGKYDGNLPSAPDKGLYLGLTEAMTNCHHHAYIEPRRDGLGQKNEPKTWWMFSQERNNKLTVVFCDLGVGIPTTLPRTEPSLWSRIVSTFASPEDGIVIEEAIKYSRSRTRQTYRGKGLRQLVDVIDGLPGAALKIYSNRGCYTYRGGVGSVETYTTSILGTLIEWTIPLSSSLRS